MMRSLVGGLYNFFHVKPREVLKNFLQDPEDKQLEIFFIRYVAEPVVQNIKSDPVLAAKMAEKEDIGSDDRLDAIARFISAMGLPDSVDARYFEVLESIVEKYTDQAMACHMKALSLDPTISEPNDETVQLNAIASVAKVVGELVCNKVKADEIAVTGVPEKSDSEEASRAGPSK